MASSGTNGKAARVPSALAMARLEMEGVGEKGRRAWPPRRSSRERMAARRGGRGDMVGCCDGGWGVDGECEVKGGGSVTAILDFAFF